MPRAGGQSRRGARAFTIVELGVSILVVAILIALLIVGIARVSETAQAGAERQNLASLRIAIDSFEADFGFLPPMMKDGIVYSTADPPRPTGPPPLMDDTLAVYREDVPEDVDFLRRATASGADLRFSVYSLATYLVGAQDQPIDGGLVVDGKAGPGLRTPRRDGTFQVTGGKVIDPLFDLRGQSERLAEVNAEEGRYELRDRNGVAYRYYRWLPDDTTAGVPAGKTVRDLLNVPELVGDPAQDVSLRDARYAIVAAGPNEVFGEVLTDSRDALIRAIGRSGSGTDADLEAAGRADNIVEVGK